MDKEFFVQNVKELCLKKGIKPTNACKESGVGGSFLSDISRGQTPSVAKVQLLAEYLDVTTSELLGEEKPIPEDEDGLNNAQHQVYKRLEKLTPENLEKAKEYLDFLLTRQDKQDSG